MTLIEIKNELAKYDGINDLKENKILIPEEKAVELAAELQRTINALCLPKVEAIRSNLQEAAEIMDQLIEVEEECQNVVSFFNGHKSPCGAGVRSDAWNRGELKELLKHF